MPSKVDVLAVVDDEIFRGTGIAWALVCTINNGMQKVVICGHVRDSIAAAFAAVFP